jgi:hypothetical protein
MNYNYIVTNKGKKVHSVPSTAAFVANKIRKMLITKKGYPETIQVVMETIPGNEEEDE